MNIGSVAGVLAASNGSPYLATKHALEAMSDSWRQELALSGIAVSLVQPGFIASKMCQKDVCDDAELPYFSAAVAHAITSSYPKSRYPVASVIVMPSWLAVWLRKSVEPSDFASS